MKLGINLKQRIGTDKRNPCFNVGLSAMSYAAQNSGESIAHGAALVPVNLYMSIVEMCPLYPYRDVSPISLRGWVRA
jgi:hypothetical protein